MAELTKEQLRTIVATAVAAALAAHPAVTTKYNEVQEDHLRPTHGTSVKDVVSNWSSTPQRRLNDCSMVSNHIIQKEED